MIGFAIAYAVPCGTPQAIRNFVDKQALVPPLLPFFLETEHFKVWYDTTGENRVWQNGEIGGAVPEYVESTAAYLERIWHYLIDTLCYIAPLPDSVKLSNPNDYGGDARTDIYLANLTGGVYGMTMIRAVDTIDGVPVATSYSVIENDFNEFSQYSQDPFSALAVTCAHEFFHNIQFAYRFSSSSEMIWWVEATSVACEEACYDWVNDYVQYIRPFQENCTDTTIFHCPHYYGGVLFPLFLMEYHSQDDRRDFTVIRRVWETTRLIPSPRYAIDEMLRAHFATNLIEDFFQFCRWRLRVGGFWTRTFFKEGENYPLPNMTEIRFESETLLVDTLPVLSCRFFILPHIFTGNGVWASFFSGPASYSRFFVEGIGNDPSGMYDTSVFAAHGEALGVPGLWRFRNVVIGAVMLSCAVPTYVSVDIGFSDSLWITPPNEVIFGAPFPNPAKESVRFPITTPDAGETILSIYNYAGELIYQSKVYTQQGENAILWHCRNNRGEKLSSGIYLYVILVQNPYGKWLESKGRILIVTE